MSGTPAATAASSCALRSPAVYFPVWVDEFGPEKSRTVWMALIQAGAPIGIMCGYVFAGVMTEDSETDTFGWRAM